MNKYYLLLSILASFFSLSNSFGYDVGVVNSVAINSINCSGEFSSLSADIENFGAQQIDSFYIYIDVNGVVIDSVSIVQTIAAGQQVNIVIGSYVITSNPSNVVTISTGLPNGTIDTQTSNDSYSFETYSRLSGNYSVGCPTCDFISVSDALNHLDDYGVCGPTNLNIEDGTHNSSQMNVSAYPGMSAANPVVIQSASQDSSAVVLAVFASPSIVLNSVQYITFRKIAIDPQAGHIGFKLNSVSNFTIENCWIKDAEVQTGFSGGGPGFHDVRIANNYFGYGSFLNFYNNGSSPANSNGLVEVIENNFYFSIARFSEFAQVQFKGNEINSPNIDEPIEFDGCENGLIAGNYLKSSGDKGLLIDVGCSSIDVINNFLRGDGEVVSVYASNNINFINNSLYQYDASEDYGEAVSINFSTGIEFINNIVQSEEYGSLVFCSDTALWNPHHNIYYSPSDSLVRFGWNHDHISFFNWTVTHGKDNGSWNWNPYYSSPLDLHINNLVIAESNAFPYPGIVEDFDGEVRNAASYDIGADEIDLDYSTLRDIALISIDEPNNTSCVQADSMKLMVANYSTFQIDSFAVGRSTFGVYNETVWNYTPLPPGDTVLVNIGAYNFSPNTSYNLELFLELPNGQPDNYELNNEGVTAYQYLGEPNISIRAVSDCSPEVELTVPNQVYSSLLWSTSETTDMITVIPPGSWTVTTTDQNGCIVNKTITLN